MPPTRKNACSGRWSYSPSQMPLNEAIVSSTGTYLPSMPVNCSATKNGWDRNRWMRARPRHDDLVLFAQLVDAEDRDDVLQVLVPLEDLLHPPRHRVVVLAHVARVEDAAGGVERVHGRVDAQRRDVTREHRRGVEVRERRVRRRVGDVVGGHVDRLQRGDRTALRRGDALLQFAHLVGERGLVADRRRHAPEQRRDLRTGLGEPEDVVDEQQHVLALHVAEVLGHRQRAQRHAQPNAGRLVHLAEHQRGVGQHAGFRSSPGTGRCPHGCAPPRRRRPTRHRAAGPAGGSSPG